jgi:hypothetical protein
MLLRQGGADIQPFEIDGLFIDAQIFKGLLPLEEPATLTLKPSELFAKLRIVSRQRYGLELPVRQSELRCLQNATNKLAVLRDVTLKLGVKLICAREFALDNDRALL